MFAFWKIHSSRLWFYACLFLGWLWGGRKFVEKNKSQLFNWLAKERWNHCTMVSFCWWRWSPSTGKSFFVGESVGFDIFYPNASYLLALFSSILQVLTSVNSNVISLYSIPCTWHPKMQWVYLMEMISSWLLRWFLLPNDFAV